MKKYEARLGAMISVEIEANNKQEALEILKKEIGDVGFDLENIEIKEMGK